MRGQNPEPVMFENLVIHYDQKKFEELLSEGNPVLHARKQRKISVAKASEAGRASSQLLLASIEAKSSSRMALQVPCKSKTLLPKQMWRPKQNAPCEASGEAPPRPRLSHEDKDKMHVRFGSFAEAISREARAATLSSPNPGAVTPSANLVLTSEATDGMANTVPVSQGMRGIPNCQAETKAPSSANHLRNKVANKAPRMLRFPTPQALSLLFTAGLRDHPGC